MATINVYEQYFEVEMKYNGVERHGALVMENGKVFWDKPLREARFG